MKRLILIILITFLALFNCEAQLAGNYIPLAFENLTPDWITVSMDSTIIDHVIPNPRASDIEFDGYSHVYTSAEIERHPIIKDGFYYKVSKTLYDVDVSGGLIEKIDVKSGKVVWQNSFDLRTEDKREFIERYIIKGDTLIVFLILVIDEDPASPLPIVALGFAEGILKIRKYNINTGQLISEIVADQNDPLTRILRNSPNDVRQLNLIGEDSLEFLEHEMDVNGARIIIDTLDYQGRYLNSSDTLFTQIENVHWGHSYWSSDFRMIRDDNGDLFWLDTYSPDVRSINPSKAYLHRVSGNNNHTIIIDIDDIDRVRFWNLIEVNENEIFIQITYHDESVSYILIDKHNYSIREIVVIKYHDNAMPFPFINNDGDLLTASYGGVENGKHVLEFYKTNGDDLLQVSSVISIDHPNYMFIPSEITKLEGGDILVEGMHTEKTQTFLGRFMTSFRVKSELVGLNSTSVDETQIGDTNNNLEIYPNPSVGEIYIKGDTNNLSNYTVSDINGKVLISRTSINDNRINLNLPSGFYVITFRDIDDSIYSKKIIIN